MVLTKQDLISCLQNEVRILVHLCGKVKPEMLDYRPTPKQRSTVELLRYLTVMGPVLVKSIQAGKFLDEEWDAGEAAAAGMDLDGLIKSFESQSAVYESAINDLTDDDFQAEIEMFGRKAKRGRLFVNFVVCGHAAYRTQLFCYLKACGRDELNTMNLWVGIDAAM
ncbi:MAG: hypothetical protein IT168_16835 [Bryobacterales bacterium]|nr:hypothetical protein [Bryobacterales bacterium]